MDAERVDRKKIVIGKGIVLLAGIAALLYLMMDVTGSYHLKAADDAICKVIYSLQCPFFTGFFKVMTNMVHPVVMLIVSMTMIHILRQRQYLVALFVNLVLAVLLNLSAKGWIMRERPPLEQRLIAEGGYSFPSGHAMLAATFYGFIIFLIWETKKNRTFKVAGTVICLAIILLVALSRIYLGVHYPTDVAGGFLAGVIYLIMYTSVARRYFEKGINIRGQAAEIEVHPLVKSFQYAFSGIVTGLKTERNMMIHYSALCLVVVFGITLKLSMTEWCICLILCALVISLELVNTAVEAVVDLITKEHRHRAKLAKDTAAGAVLIAAITSAIIGGLLFFPKILALFTT